MTESREVRTTRHDPDGDGRAATFKLTTLIWLLVGLLEAALALRFVFRLIGVNEANAFASFLYNLTDFFLAPFANLTGSPSTGSMVVEIPTLIAMAIYLLIGWALDRIIYVLFYRPTTTISTRQTVVDERYPTDEVIRTRRQIPNTGDDDVVIDDDIRDDEDVYPDEGDENIADVTIADDDIDRDDIERPRNPL